MYDLTQFQRVAQQLGNALDLTIDLQPQQRVFGFEIKNCFDLYFAHLKYDRGIIFSENECQTELSVSALKRALRQNLSSLEGDAPVMALNQEGNVICLLPFYYSDSIQDTLDKMNCVLGMMDDFIGAV